MGVTLIIESSERSMLAISPPLLELSNICRHVRRVKERCRVAITPSLLDLNKDDMQTCMYVK